MKIESIEQIQKFRRVLEMEFGELPENVYIHAPKAIEECLNFQTNQPEVMTDIQICGVNVLKDFAEIY